MTTTPELTAEVDDLRARLAEAEEALRAIRDGEVDAVLVAGERGERQVFTLSGVDRAYRMLIETMSEGAATLSADRVILYCNARLAQMLGQPLDQVMGTDLRNYLLPADQLALDAVLAQVQTVPIRRELNMKASDGHLVPVYLSASRLPADETESVFCLVLTDMTGQKSHERILSSELRYRRLFESAKDGILILDAETGMVLDVNPFLLQLLGFSHEEFLGKKIWELGFFKDIVANQDNFAELQQQEYISYEDKPLQTADGRRVDVEFVSNVYLVDHQKVIQCDIRDISARKQAEEKRIKLESQLRQSLKLEAVGQLAGGVAHDFNNMLSVINGYSEMLLRELGQSDPNYSRILEINKAGNRSADLTRQLLAFARKQPISPKVLDLNDAIDGMLKMLRRLIGENINLAWMPGGNLGKVKIDPSQIDQLLANLLVNARDAISGKGSVIIETCNVELDEAFCRIHPDSIPGKYVVLSVSDSGCGMSKEIQEHIFEPFFTTKKFGEGTGLGLATVFGIVKQNSGFINIFSEPGKGSTFKIYLPWHESSHGEEEQNTVKNKILTGTETVLIVEDERTLLQYAKQLVELLGYTVLDADNPNKAIQIAREYKGTIHLLLTDMLMPEMSGKELGEKLREMRPGIKCLFMSGYTADIMSRNGILDEGIYFLEKPFTAEDLSVKIREVLCLP